MKKTGAIGRAFSGIFDLDGRATRKEFWLGSLCALLMALVIPILLHITVSVISVKIDLPSNPEVISIAETNKETPPNPATQSKQVPAPEKIIQQDSFNFKDVALYTTILLLLVISVYSASIIVTSAIRRLHDIDKSGWWLVAPIAFSLFIDLYTSIAVYFYHARVPETLRDVSFYLTLICAILLFIVLCLPSSKGENRFGPPVEPQALPNPEGSAQSI